MKQLEEKLFCLGFVLLMSIGRTAVSQGLVRVEIREHHSGKLLPARLTVTDMRDSLQMLDVDSSDSLANAQVAVRRGTIYTGNGKAAFRLAAGRYKVYATRGFEYSCDSAAFDVGNSKTITKTLRIAHEVDVKGYISSDTHIHTFTHSRHGDATDRERILTIAGEGIELPIITDHNVHADLNPAVKSSGLSGYFTLVNGVEITTPVGHFNHFPIELSDPVLPFKINSWDELGAQMRNPKHKLTILNHARDIHNNFRPFDPKNHIASAGQTLTGWNYPFNAIEIFNSSAQMSDMTRLFRDWLGLLNAGYVVTPIGSSDSHDVILYMLGQARTYIKAKDTNPAEIDIKEAIESLVRGKVMVSFGLLTELIVNENFAAGDTLHTDKSVNVTVNVSGPGWTSASKVVLYANGQKIKEEVIFTKNKPGLKWTKTWTIPKPDNDVVLVAMAEGPDPKVPFWRISEPYQKTSSFWDPHIYGFSGAVFVDADQKSGWQSARHYAADILETAGQDWNEIFRKLNQYDEAVAVQAANLLQLRGKPVAQVIKEPAFKKASAAVKAGFSRFMEEYSLTNTADTH